MTTNEHFETADDPLLGHVVDGRFEIIRRLGAGAMGTVYLARQLSLDVLRALKVIDPGTAKDLPTEKRFRREALAMSRLQHAHIAQVIDFGALEQGGHYLAMEYIDGGNLRQLIAQRGSLRLADGLAVIQGIAAAIAYAHGKGIVHRDLKPANILLQERDVTQVKVIDFGLAKLATGEAMTQLTADEQILGTPMFMAPEQCLSEGVGPPVDVYGLAGLAYYCLSGKPVFLERSVTGIIMAQTYHEPVPISHRCPDQGIPSTLDTLLLECLRKKPNERPAAAEVLMRLKEIDAWIESDPLQQTTLQPRPPELETSSILDRPEVLASTIWLERPEDPAATGGRSHRAEALFNQLTAFLMEFAEQLQNHLNLTGSVGVITHRIDQLQGTASGLEMDLALLEAELAELEADPSATAGIENRREALRTQVTDLASSVNREYRNLYKYVVSYRKEVHEPGLQTYYAELERLIRAYLGELDRDDHSSGGMA